MIGFQAILHFSGTHGVHFKEEKIREIEILYEIVWLLYLFQGTWVDEATGVKKKTEQKLVVSSVARPNPAVTSWNKKVGGWGRCFSCLWWLWL